MYGYELTPQEFLFAYYPFGLFGKKGFFSLTAQLGKKIIDKIPTKQQRVEDQILPCLQAGVLRQQPPEASPSRRLD